MASAVSDLAPARKVRLGQVALPVEHGSWGLLFEPIVAGLAIAFSTGGAWVSVMIIGVFLIRQPLKILFIGRLAGRRLPQTPYAIKFALGYLVIFAAGMIGSIKNVELRCFIPFALSLPLAAYQVYSDAARRSRQMLAELLSSLAISSTIAVIALADGWTATAAYSLWALMAARSIASIMYVRERLNLEKGKAYSRTAPIAAHVVGFLLILALAFSGSTPYLVVAAFAVLLVRCVIGLSSYRKRVKAMRIGIGEVIYGTITVLSVIVGHFAGF